MKRKIIAIFSIICIITVFIVTGIVVQLNQRIVKNPVGTVGNTAGNLYNGGLFCEDDGYVYFSNPYDTYALYRMRPNETEIEKLIQTETGSINAAGKYFYFYQKGSGSGEGFGYMISTTGIYRAEKENPNKIECLDRILSETMVLADNSIYYNTAKQEEGVNLKKIDIDGENAEILLNYKVTPACVNNSAIYFNNTTDNGHLMQLPLGSKNAADILAEDVYMPIVDGTTVYYIDIHNNYALISYDMSSGEKTVLTTERTDTYNISDLFIYYQTAGETPQLKRISKDGAFSEVVADGAYHNINITSQYVYFQKFGVERPVYKTPVNGVVTVSTFDSAKLTGF
ncbi:MAG: DUF5050 domain-containing protein [Lachnospiraceae bacterium]|nr:DUF5050 domain-containing protein [Lachnospiraceae bacterium]